VTLANHTPFGLSASVWAESVGVALDTAAKLQAGVVWVNSHNLFDAAVGFGGCKQSGFGREGGKEGLFEYLVPAWQAAQGRARVLPAALKAAAEAPAAPAAGQALGPGAAAAGGGGVDRTAKVFIGGKQTRSDSGASFPVLAADGAPAGQACDCNRKDARDAVEAAAGAARGWGAKSGHVRAQILFYLAENLGARAGEFAARVAQVSGSAPAVAAAEVAAAVERLFAWAALADKAGGRVQESTLQGLVMAVNEPVGAVALVSPDDAPPLLALVSLLAPAVARGNAVVLVPPRRAALLAADLYQARPPLPRRAAAWRRRGGAGGRGRAGGRAGGRVLSEVRLRERRGRGARFVRRFSRRATCRAGSSTSSPATNMYERPSPP
jgi:aldehyde dehydrogenase (NAD+)